MRALSSISVLCLVVAVLFVGCAEEIAPTDAYLATWNPQSSSGIAGIPDAPSVPDDNPIPVPDPETDPAVPGTDKDNDGVAAELDCNDHNPELGRLLYLDGLVEDSGYFKAPPQLADAPWLYGDTTLTSTGGGQQATLGKAEDWGDVFIYAVVSAEGTIAENCQGADNTATERWRAGLVARAALDPNNATEGFSGYRCAVGSDATGEDGLPFRGPSTGQFVQIAEFGGGPGPSAPSECDDDFDPSFAELDRSSITAMDITGQDSAVLSFAVRGDQLQCDLVTTRGTISASAQSSTFSTGGVGFSTLNMYGKFHWISVCELN